MSYLQHSLQLRAGGFLVLVEGVGIDVQRGGGLGVTKDARHCGHVCAARDHQTGGGVAQAVDVQMLRQAVLFQDALEPPCEGGGRHGQACALSAEQEVCCSQFSFIVGLGDVLAFPLIFTQERFHLGGEVDVPVTGTGLGFLDEYLVAGDFYGIAADVDGTLFPVDVPPLQGAALTTPHPCGDDEFEVRLILDALILQRGDDLLRRFLVGNLFPCFLTCVARHGSGDRTPISMEYAFCCELRVSFMAGRLALPRLALDEEIDVPIAGNVLSSNGFPVMSRFG